MKIEANPTPEQLKWIVLVILIAAGLGHEQILGLLAQQQYQAAKLVVGTLVSITELVYL